MSIVISSGHGKYVRGASGIIDEVDEARKVVDAVTTMLKSRGVGVKSFHDNTSHDQNTNLNTIVNYHNAQARDLDVSVHFNAFEQTSSPRGCEVWYMTQSTLASKVSSAIANSGSFINRGSKKTSDLFFLSNTTKPAILIEVCFVDSEADCGLYGSHFNAICDAITISLGGEGEAITVPPPGGAHNLSGKCSHFGGPDDTGVSPSEGLAFISDYMQAPHLFLPYQPEGTTGLARRLNAHIHYIACRWDYDATPKASLLATVALVRAKKNGVTLKAFPADWGPNETTGRIADISPGLMDDLGIMTDDEIEIIYPYEEGTS